MGNWGMIYDWKAAGVFFVSLVVLTVVGRRLIFLVPAFQEMRKLNREADRPKLARDRFKKAVKASNQTGLYTNLAFYILVLPFAISLESRPLWRHAVDVVAVLLLFDFFYYLTHRFIFLALDHPNQRSFGDPIDTTSTSYKQSRPING